MSKLYDELIAQQEKHPSTEVLEIYEFLKNTTGGVWNSQWRILTDVYYKGFPSSERWFEPSKLWLDLKEHFKNQYARG